MNELYLIRKLVERGKVKYLNTTKNKEKASAKASIKKIESKKGVALAETILLIAISLVLVIVLFYPSISGLFNTLLSNLNNWFSQALTRIGCL
ncbi:MAG: hypothetical protein RSE00_02045 [Clostridia bacterium]